MVASLSDKIHSPLVFDDLTKGFAKKDLLARVLHFWEARNIKKGGLLMGLELLLLDQKSTTIQAFIPANRIGYYEKNLKPDVVYKIKNFLVINNKTTYKVTSHKFLIQFTQQTTFVQADQDDSTIERKNFRIRSYDEFSDAVNKNEDLYDAIGKLILINDENFRYLGETNDIANGVSHNKIDVHLQLKDGPIVRVTLWGNVAANFHKKIMKSVVKPVVLLATTMNPRTFQEVLCLNSTSSTRVFFDKDVEATTDYLTWLGEEGRNSEVITSEVTKSETVTISELYQFLQNDTPQTATFCCNATIVDVLPQYGWYFIACTKCKCKLRRSDTALVCNTCNHANTVGIIKYRVELTVCDDDNVATFVVWDRETTKLAGRKAADILEEDEQGDQQGAIDNHSSIPQCLTYIIGRTYKFKVKLSPFNFTATRQTITVTDLFDQIIDGDKILEEEAAETNEVDTQTNTSDVGQGQSVCTDADDDTDDIKHKDKRLRRT